MQQKLTHGITTVNLTQGTRRRRAYIKQDEMVYDTTTVIGIDPGGTTGWSLISVNPESLVDNDIKILDSIYDHEHGEVDCGVHRGNLDSTLHSGISTDGEFGGVYDVLRLLREWPCAAVVIEDFVLNVHRRDRDLLSPVRITSAIGYQLWIDGRDYHVQSPGDAKNVCSDTSLKNWGMYDKYGGLKHARDADRHSILFLRKAKQKKEFRERAWPFLYGEGGPYER